MPVDFERAAENARKQFDSMTDEDLAKWQAANDEEHRSQHIRFRQGYEQGKCYLCNKDFKTVSKDDPCLHWLLRLGKFKPKDIKLIGGKFGYIQVAAYLRWCANEERLLANINDIEEEASEGKFLSSTIRWKNIEWTFDCSANDLAGHGGSHSNFPHYHFQMRIDGRQFINFNDYHLPFSDADLLSFRLRNEPGFHFDFGVHGAGMSHAMQVDPELIIENTIVSASEEDAGFGFSTMIMSKSGTINGDDIYKMIQESKRTGKSIASISRKFYENDESVNIGTIISPSDSVPEITPRTEMKRR
ncbi:hypothetical protein DKY63_29515 [Pseudomonas putida]|uniref:Uncharacterized protein n=1 Tax=Pseudomonas putida TaxID=303 RepID=A0A2Z4RU64_PSEPU|nr:hypothetical protein [Pseudomonas putida]AWY43828.1 hypothetical protein DKY63_29515 [Pseudomonas putida]